MSHRRVITLLAAGFLAVAMSASGQTWGRPPTPDRGACFYRDINYRGQYFCTTAGSSHPRISAGMNDEISSIRIFGNTEVTVFRDSNYEGSSRTFDSNVNNLKKIGFNDRISSYRVDRRGYWSESHRSDRGMAWGHPTTPASGACFYQDVDYGGRYFCAPAGTTAGEVPPGENDEISSIRIFGNTEVTVYRDSRLRGPFVKFDSSVRNLRSVGMNDRISSFRVDQHAGRRVEADWGHPTVPRSGACFYRDADYGGGYFCAAVGTSAPRVPPGMNDEISSIRLFGNAEVIVYRDSDFRGDSRKFRIDVRDLHAAGMNDRISSYRVEKLVRRRR